MINFKKMSKAEAKKFVDDINQMSDVAFEDLTRKWKNTDVTEFDQSYLPLRKAIVDAFLSAPDNKDYAKDLNVGLTLFDYLNPANGFSIVYASDDDIWRYLECIVFPDLTYLRYPEPQQGDIRLVEKRFYSHTRRIWLKTLWWYVFLSWQGNVGDTYTVLEDLGSNYISHLVERPGKGYRVNMLREMMKQYSMLDTKTTDIFNSVQKQNLVNCKTIEPALTEEGENGYVTNLLKQVGCKKENG